MKLFWRNHSAPDKVNSCGTPSCSCISLVGFVYDRGQLYPVVESTGGSEALIPQYNVSRDLCSDRGGELRAQGRVGQDVAACKVVDVLAARAGKRKGLNGNIGLV